MYIICFTYQPITIVKAWSTIIPDLYKYRFLRPWNIIHWKNAWISSSIHIMLRFWRQKWLCYIWQTNRITCFFIKTLIVLMAILKLIVGQLNAKPHPHWL